MIKQLKINRMKNLNYKTMRKIVFSLLMLLTLSLSAQVKFLGIPVDGTKSEMISKLKQKGYSLCKEPKLAELDVLEGEFNGKDVHIAVVTNNNKVYRIVVQDVQTTDETGIKIRYNNLVHQFKSNKRYWSSPYSEQYLDDDFDISYEMLVNNQRIQADFTQKLSDEDIQKILDVMPELKDQDPDIQEVIFNQAAYESNRVWFMISKLNGYNEYWIALYYENLNNAPNGDDL